MKQVEKNKIIEVEFTKIVPEGKSLGKWNGKVVFCYGILPNEVARVKILKEKKNYIEAELIEITESSPFRIREQEEHYLSCSPWQTFDYEFQIQLKKALLKEIYYQIARETIDIDKFIPSPLIYGYRTKMEFSFSTDNKKIYLAFYKRGSKNEKYILEKGCILASEFMNKIALKILDYLNIEKYAINYLKGLTIRESKSFNERIAVLFLMNKEKIPKIALDKIENLSGLIFVYSDPKSPAFVVSEIIKKEGQDFLKEKIGELDIFYDFRCFFQNNIQLFNECLKDIKENINEVNKIIELYSGVGSIILNLNKFAKKIIGVEIEKNSVNYAKINAQINEIKNFDCLESPAEKLSIEFLKDTDILVLDPPRSGLHKKVINIILDNLPNLIVYLSCNPITQARDFLFLKDKYKIKKIIGYDFYPNTPHMESLLILEKKNKI